MRLLSLLLLLLASPALAAGPGVSLVDPNGAYLGTAANPLLTAPAPGVPSGYVADPNNAAYQSASAPFATGASVPPGRALYLSCPAAGTVTLSLSAGGSIAYPVAAGGTVLPFAVVSVSADSAGCTHQVLQ